MPRQERLLRASFLEEEDVSSIMTRSRRSCRKRPSAGRAGRASCISSGAGEPCEQASATGSSHPVPSPPPEAASPWRLFAAALLLREGRPLSGGFVPCRAAFARRREPSALEVRRWQLLHGTRAACGAQAQELRPYEMTLSYQHQRAAMLQDCQRERRLHRAWRRMLVRLCSQQRQQARQLALSAAAEPAVAAPPPADESSDVDNWLTADQLGLDEATYQALRALAERDIEPEDYELLSRLDEGMKPATLDDDALQRFPTETYRAGALGNAAPGLGPFFWRLPLPSAEHGEDSGAAGSADSAEAEACGVCLVDFEDGDDLRRLLPCGHRFHRGCIDHWLLKSSTVCPVDKRDLRCGH